MLGGPLALWGAVWLVVAVTVAPSLDSLATRLVLGVSIVATFIVGAGLAMVAEIRNDRASVAGTGSRIARGQTSRLRDVIGPLRCAVLAATVAVDLVFVAEVGLRYPARDDLAVGAVLLLGCAGVAALMTAALRRPTIATDAISLAIDERLRAQEVARPLAIGYLTTYVAVDLIESAALAPVALVATMLALGLNAAASLQRRWPDPGRARAGWRW